VTRRRLAVTRNPKVRRRIAAGKLTLRIRDLRNLGPRTETMLAKVGIHSVANLRRIGGLEAYWRLRRANVTQSLNALWALVGALEPWPEGRHWRQVSSGDERLALLLSIESREQAREQVLTAAGSKGPAARRKTTGRKKSAAPRGKRGSELLDPMGMLLPERSGS
jgi:DNA transformation protein